MFSPSNDIILINIEKTSENLKENKKYLKHELTVSKNLMRGYQRVKKILNSIPHLVLVYTLHNLTFQSKSHWKDISLLHCLKICQNCVKIMNRKLHCSR